MLRKREPWRPSCDNVRAATLLVPKRDVLRTNVWISPQVDLTRFTTFTNLFFLLGLLWSLYCLCGGWGASELRAVLSLSLCLGLRGKQLPCPRGNVAFFPIRLFACDGQRPGFGPGCDVGCSLWARTQRGVEPRGCFWQSHPPTPVNGEVTHDGDPPEPVVRASGEKTCSLTSELALCMALVFSFSSQRWPSGDRRHPHSLFICVLVRFSFSFSWGKADLFIQRKVEKTANFTDLIFLQLLKGGGAYDQAGRRVINDLIWLVAKLGQYFKSLL